MGSGSRASRSAGMTRQSRMTDQPRSFLRWREIPASIWALGLVSLLMDVSSEMIHALLPLYLVGVLGASTLTVGVIEGIAEATASITKIFSGALSDWLGKRKFLAVLGYGLAALSQTLFSFGPPCRLARRRPLYRSRRQGHPRRAPRRAHRRYHPHALARREFR